MEVTPSSNDMGQAAIKDGQLQEKTVENHNAEPNPDTPGVQVERARSLRKRAEEAVKAKKLHYSESWLPEQAQILLHELRVHQIEMEAQNEELRQTQKDLEAVRAKYFNFYNLAPVGYFTVSGQGLILEANSMAEYLLGAATHPKANTPFTRFIFPEDQDIYHLFHKKLLETGMPQTCELRMARHDGSRFWGRLEATVAEDVEGREREIRIAIIDITDRKTAEDALIHSETKYHTLYDSTTDAVMLLDTKGFFDCNKAALAIFGCATREEFCSRHPADFSPPEQPCGTDSMALANQRIATALEKGSLRFEWEYKRNDTGKTFPAEVLLNAMELDGKPILQAVVRDITERKRVEEDIRRSEERLRAIFEQAGVGVAIVESATGKFLRVNHKYAEIVGLSAEELLLSSFDKITHPDDLQIDWANMEKLKNGLIAEYSMDKRYIHRNGSIVWVSLTVSPLWHEGRDLKQHIAIVNDIAERKRAEEALRESEARYRELFNNASDYIFTIDMEGRFTSINQACLDLTGYTAEEIIGASMGQFVAPEHLAIALENLRKKLRGEATTARYDLDIIAKDGRRITMELGTSAIYSKGAPAGVLGIARNVTERNRAQEEFRLAKEKAEAATKLKD